MPFTIYESNGAKKQAAYSIVAGHVTNNCDRLVHGKVLVRIPSHDQEVVARLTGPGAGSGGGIQYTPRVGDEVVVALNQGDPTDAFVLNGAMNPPPASKLSDLLTKRVFKTGIVDGIGHELEFDDAQQSITITSSTKQKIKIDRTQIALTNFAGTLTITLDNTSQAISIQAAGSIELKALKSITLAAGQVKINGLKDVSVTGTQVYINSPQGAA